MDEVEAQTTTRQIRHQLRVDDRGRDTAYA